MGTAPRQIQIETASLRWAWQLPRSTCSGVLLRSPFQTCARAVARLLPAAGAHAIFHESSLQRAMRDTQVLATHMVADWDMGRESYARALLDLPVDDPAF